MEDDFQSLLCSYEEPRDIIRKCMPDLVKKLELDPVLDYVIAGEAISADTIVKYEEKKDSCQRRDLNRWFLRRFVLTGNSELSQQLILAIYKSQDEVAGHHDLVQLIRGTLSGSTVSMEVELPLQPSFTQSTVTIGPSVSLDPPVQLTVDPSVQSAIDPSVQSAVDLSQQSTVDSSVSVDSSLQSAVDPSVQSAVDPSVQSAVDPSLQSAVDPSVQSTVDSSISVDPSLQSAVDPSVQSAVDSSVQSAVDPSVQSTVDSSVSVDPSLQLVVDPSVQSAVDPLVQSTVDSSVSVDPSLQSAVGLSVQSAIDPSAQSTVDSSVQSAVDPSVQSTVDSSVSVDPSLQLVVDPSVQSAVDPSVQSTVDSSVFVDPSLQSAVAPSVQSAIDPSAQSTVDSSVQSAVDPSVQSTFDLSVSVDPSLQLVVDPSVQSAVDPSIQSTVDSSVSVDPSLQSVVDPSVQSVVDPSLQLTVDPSVQSVVDPSVQSAVDSSLQSTVDPSVQSVVDPSVQSVVDPSLQSTVDPTVQSVVDPSVQSAVDSSLQSTVDPSVQSTVDLSVQSTVDPSVQSAVDPSVQSTMYPSIQSMDASVVLDTSVQSTVDPSVQSTVYPSVQSMDASVVLDTSVQSTIDPSVAVDASVQSMDTSVAVNSPVQLTIGPSEVFDPSTQSTINLTETIDALGALDSSVQTTDNPSGAVDPSMQSIVDPAEIMDTSVITDLSIPYHVPTDHKPASPFTFTMPEGKELREYQKELAALGMEGVNYIVCAPTGTGKTLIASMVVASHLAKRPDGKVVLLVNKVPLAEQQCNEVKRYIPDLKGQFITGDSGTQLSLAQLLRDNDMVVCTDGVFVNELKTAPLSSAERLSLNNISLLIIDECHNAKKNSPYAMIMEQYVKIKIKSQSLRLPQIMGLTASPGAGENPQGEVDKTLEHLLNLCALLDAQGGISVVKKNKIELAHFHNQPDFDLLKTNPRSTRDPFLQLLQSTMKTLESWVMQYFDISCPHGQQHQAYENWVVNQRQQSELRYGQRERDLRVALNYLQCYYNSLKMYLELNQDDAVAILEEKIILTAEEKATDSEKLFQQIFRSFIDRASLITSVENPMLVRLRELLEVHFQKLPSTQGIVFATTKDTAQRMWYWLQGIPQLKGVIKPQVVTGQGKEEIGGMTLQKQRSTIEKFRESNCNLLIATTVLEEGLDVAACNLVVRYNHVTNEIARVQAQGRARAKDSRCYAIMVMDSPKVLQEQLNKEKGDLTLEAMEFLPAGDKLGEEIRTRQKQLLKDRERQQKLREELKTQDGSSVQLLCKGCDLSICNLTDVRVVGESHHVIIDNKINERCIKRGPSTMIPKGEVLLGKKVFCGTCEREWGVMMKWPHNGMHYPAIKCKFILFRHPTGEKHYYKQWKSIPFIIEKYQ